MAAEILNGYENSLKPYAAKASNSLGRAHKEEEHPYRSPFQRDRDRIVHSAAFRRLESKTQVYTHLYQQGDRYRKRLTHSLEVAGIARNISRALGLNEDLAEAIALAHDLGHSPFGHKGQDILDELMKGYGGFEHNTQALRIVSIIEHRYPDFAGLNLTYETREGIAKKRARQEEPLKKEFEKFPNPSLEAQIVDISDPIAYSTHDLDDGITAEMITDGMLKELPLWNEVKKSLLAVNPDMPEKILKFQAVRHIINAQVTDLINETVKNINNAGPKTIEDIRNNPKRLAAFSPEMEKKHKELKNFLRKNMYENTKVKRMEHKAREVLTGLYKAFLEDYTLLPTGIHKHYLKAKEKGNERRIVCDYIAGMTDRFALNEWNDIFDPKSPIQH